jgi:hypothetical protein
MFKRRLEWKNVWLRVDKRVSKAFISQTCWCFMLRRRVLRTCKLKACASSRRATGRGGVRAWSAEAENRLLLNVNIIRHMTFSSVILLTRKVKQIQSFHGKKFLSFYAVSVLYFYGALFALPRPPYEQPRRLLVFSDSLTIVSALF